MSEKVWYPMEEAVSIIQSALNSDLPYMYWRNFIYNHSRGIRGDDPKNPAWTKMETKDFGGKDIRISEDSLQKFLLEAKNRSFPLRSRNLGYTRNSVTKTVAQPQADLDLGEREQSAELQIDEYFSERQKHTLENTQFGFGEITGFEKRLKTPIPEKKVELPVGASRIKDPSAIQVFVSGDSDGLSFALIINGKMYGISHEVFKSLAGQVEFCESVTKALSLNPKLSLTN